MSDCMIIRRGGGGQGFDPNGAVLKVITSTGCTVLVTGTGYSKTHQQADGFPRSSDANVTEHFFSIPASAFGTITVTVSKVYTNEGVSDTLTASKTITVNTAGEVYELLIAAPNIILNSTFGLQEGWSINRGAYNNVTKQYKLSGNPDQRLSYDLLFNNANRFSLAPYDQIDITVSTVNTSGGNVVLKMNQGDDHSYLYNYKNVSIDIDPYRAHNPFGLTFTVNAYSYSSSTVRDAVVSKIEFV